MGLKSLPIDLLYLTCGFLSGFDVFYLSHTSSWGLSVLSGNSLWQHRVVANTEVNTSLPHGIWKQRYMQACSIQFVDRNSNFRRGAKRSQLAYAILECPDLPAFWHHRFRLRSETHTSFSFDVWFCCFPSTATQPSGGVIYGVQNSRVSIRHQGCISEQFVVVDAQNKLYCSVLNEKQAVCQLSQNRWYHVALTYDVKRQCQDVYVDGRRVWSAIGSLNRKWQRCNYEQIGTGFCENIPTAEDPFIPFLELESGWYSFHGIVDEFRVWRSALPPVAIGKLGRAEHLDGFEIRATVKPSHGRRNLWIRTKSVRCTRPAEGKTMSIYGSVFV